MAQTKIEWADAVWNPVVGCTKVSRGCRNCYAEQLARRFMDIKNFSAGDRSIQHVFLKPDRLRVPLHWKKPCRVFVNSMSDLFHEDVPDSYIARVLGQFLIATQHTGMVLTKRPERMLQWVTEFLPTLNWASYWPIPNVWLGVSVENQWTADERIPLLLKTPAAVRFVSYEPALAGVDFGTWSSNDNKPDWVIIGGESGPHARPFNLAWARYAIAQCKAAGIPCFVKQLGAHPYEHLQLFNWRGETLVGQFRDERMYLRDRKGGDPDEWPPELRVREFPNESRSA